jgi:hypothetical protein
MRALIKRLAYYSPIDNSTIVSFVYFRVDPEPRTTLHVKICELRQREVRRFSLPRIPVHKAYGEKGRALLEAPPLPARPPHLSSFPLVRIPNVGKEADASDRIRKAHTDHTTPSSPKA